MSFISDNLSVIRLTQNVFPYENNIPSFCTSDDYTDYILDFWACCLSFDLIYTSLTRGYVYVFLISVLTAYLFAENMYKPMMKRQTPPKEMSCLGLRPVSTTSQATNSPTTTNTKTLKHTNKSQHALSFNFHHVNWFRLQKRKQIPCLKYITYHLIHLMLALKHPTAGFKKRLMASPLDLFTNSYNVKNTARLVRTTRAMALWKFSQQAAMKYAA